jgi:hypothetical protein
MRCERGPRPGMFFNESGSMYSIVGTPRLASRGRVCHYYYSLSADIHRNVLKDTRTTAVIGHVQMHIS